MEKNAKTGPGASFWQIQNVRIISETQHYIFESRDSEIGPRKNLPIGSGTMILEFEGMPMMLYII